MYPVAIRPYNKYAVAAQVKDQDPANPWYKNKNYTGGAGAATGAALGGMLGNAFGDGTGAAIGAALGGVAGGAAGYYGNDQIQELIKRFQNKAPAPSLATKQALYNAGFPYFDKNAFTLIETMIAAGTLGAAGIGGKAIWDSYHKKDEPEQPNPNLYNKGRGQQALGTSSTFNIPNQSMTPKIAAYGGYYPYFDKNAGILSKAGRVANAIGPLANIPQNLGSFVGGHWGYPGVIAGSTLGGGLAGGIYGGITGAIRDDSNVWEGAGRGALTGAGLGALGGAAATGIARYGYGATSPYYKQLSRDMLGNYTIQKTMSPIFAATGGIGALGSIGAASKYGDRLFGQVPSQEGSIRVLPNASDLETDKASSVNKQASYRGYYPYFDKNAINWAGAMGKVKELGTKALGVGENVWANKGKALTPFKEAWQGFSVQGPGVNRFKSGFKGFTNSDLGKVYGTAAAALPMGYMMGSGSGEKPNQQLPAYLDQSRRTAPATNLASHRGYYSYLDKLAGVEGVALEAAIPLGQQILAKIRAGIVPGLIGTGIIAPVGYGLYRGARALMSDDDPGGLIENEMDVPWYQKRQGVTAAGAGLGATLGGIGGGMTLGGIGTITGGILGGVGGAVVADSLYPYIPR